MGTKGDQLPKGELWLCADVPCLRCEWGLVLVEGSCGSDRSYSYGGGGGLVVREEKNTERSIWNVKGNLIKAGKTHGKRDF